ncbi:hypothetical protein T552_04196 [Pneumocystis carinii B80]|uniref:ER membrane protein complex subunit 7 beta-sandwich domain-containing protein n=1 Tax=Pneumocystis carinii (strain B80) TaxID=1408658 RepID=A0A0W4ZCK9_PNEC8|nr:hypothetical protein T552_04196 [Pneumocystis carinii B80]KTW26143.1 hypothetical protein T552_04196 [Pneumocystis carinii B80]
MKFQVLYIFLILAKLVLSIELKGSIIPNAYLSSPKHLPSSTVILLSSANILKRTHLTSRGDFSIKNVTEGSYLLEVVCSTHLFDPLRVDISLIKKTQTNEIDLSAEKDSETSYLELIKVYKVYRGNKWDDFGPKMPYPIQFSPVGVQSYDVKKGSSKILLLKNPIIQLSIIAIIILFVFPKLMATVDTEQLMEYQRVQAQRKERGHSNEAQSFDMASWLSNKTLKNSELQKNKKN